MEPLLNKNYIVIKEAARHSGYSVDYLMRLCRAGRIVGTQVGRTWLVKRTSLEQFVRTQEEKKKEMGRELSKVREAEYKQVQSPKTATFIPVVKATIEKKVNESPRLAEIHPILRPAFALAVTVLVLTASVWAADSGFITRLGGGVIASALRSQDAGPVIPEKTAYALVTVGEYAERGLTALVTGTPAAYRGATLALASTPRQAAAAAAFAPIQNDHGIGERLAVATYRTVTNFFSSFTRQLAVWFGISTSRLTIVPFEVANTLHPSTDLPVPHVAVGGGVSYGPITEHITNVTSINGASVEYVNAYVDAYVTNALRGLSARIGAQVLDGQGVHRSSTASSATSANSVTNGTISNSVITNSSFTGGDIIADSLQVNGNTTITGTTTISGPLVIGGLNGITECLHVDTNGVVSGTGSDCGSGGGGGITGVRAQYSTIQTGATQTFATSSDANIGLTITSAGNTHTFTPVWTGVLSVARGGLGLGSVTANGLLIGNSAGTGYTTVATTSLGFSTSDISEGANLYYTLSRFAAALAGTTTDALAEGVVNRYYTDARARNAFSATATGLTYTAGTGVLSLTSGYEIPLSASTSNWQSFYTTPSSRITAGTNLSWAGNTLNGPTDSYIRALLTATSPLAYDNTTGTFSIQQANGSQNGYLSATDWTTFNTKFATTSTNYWLSTKTTDNLAQGSVNLYYDNALVATFLNTIAKEYFFSTSSADYWKSQRDLFSTTSASYFLAQNQGAAFSTTSSDFWLTTKTTDNLAQGSTNKYYNDSLVNAFIGGSTTIPKTYTTNVFTGGNTFGLATVTSATTTNLNIVGTITGAGLTSCSLSSSKLLWDSATGQFSCGADAGAGGGITALKGQYSAAQTGSTQTFATTSDTNIGLTITSAGDTHTFSPVWIGTLAAARGGTGLSSVASSSVLIGGAGNTITQMATSSLGLESPLTFNTPLSRSGNAISIQVANGSQNGYLSSTDWNTFNNKVSSTSLSATYPVQYNSGTGVFSLAFGTSTSNTWGGTQTFTNTPVLGTLSGLVGSNNGSLYQIATSTNFVTSLTGGTGINVSGATGAITVTNTGVTAIAQSSGTNQTGAITLATSTVTANGQTHGIAITNSTGTFTFTPTISGTLGVAGGGTGAASFTAGQILYGNGTNALSSVGTTTETLGSEFSYTGTLGSLVGGTSGTLSLATNGVALTKIAQIGANTILGNNTGATGNVVAFATSTLFGAGTNGFVLAVVNGVPTWTATSSINNGVSSIQQLGGGSAQTGAITFATSSATNNGVTIGLNITNTGGAFTFTPTRSGTLTVAGGGTGITSIASSSLLIGGPGNTFIGYATSSLGIALADTTGTLLAARGGTGFASYTPGDILYADTAASLARVASSTDGFILGLANGKPTWVATTTLSSITGTLAIAKGGTGTTTAPSGQILYGGGAGVYQSAATGTVSSGTGISVTGNQYIIGSGLTITNTGVTSVAQSFGTNQTGAITLATSSAVSFNGLSFTNSITNSSGTFTFTPALSGTLTVAGGGTGVSSFTAGQLVYGNGTNNLTSVATSSQTLSAEFSDTGTFGALVGGTSGTLSLATNGVAYSKLAQAAANTILGNPTGATGNLQAIATSSLGIAISDTTGTLSVARGGTGSTTLSGILRGNGTGQVSTLIVGSGLTFDGTTLATSGAGITSIGAAGQQQTGGTQTFATSTGSFNGLTLGMTVVSSANTHTFTPSITGTLGVAGGGTGAASFTAGALVYGAGTGALQTVSTSTETLSSEFAYTGTLGALVGGSSGTLSLATNGVALGKIAQIGANTILGNNTGATGNVVAFATSTLFGTGVGGQVLAIANGVPTWIASTTYSSGSGISTAFAAGNLTITNTGLLSLQQLGGGSAQTGAITFATSSQTTNGQTIGLNITNTSGAFTFAPTIGGTLTVAGGGTGQASFTAGQILYGNGTNALSSVATSSVSVGSSLTVAGTLGSLIGGSNVTLSLNTNNPNTWTALQTFSAGASSTQISAATGFFNSVLATSSSATSTFAGGFSAASSLYVLQGGKIGIGTAAPGTTLDVVGTSRVSSTFTLSSVTSCTGAQALQTNGSGDISCGNIATGGASSGGGWTTNNIGAISLSTTTDKVVIGASTTPYAKLAVISGSAATTTLAILPASGQTANIVDIYNANGLVNSVINSSGFLGLATTSPTQQLSVQGNGIFSGNIALANLTATGTVSTSNLTVTGVTSSLLSTDGSGVVQSTSVSSPLSFSGSTLSIANAAANGATKGAATFLAADFNDDGSGGISIDYTNGQKANGSQPGFLAAADWSVFNNKISSTSLSAVYPLAYNSATGVFSTAFGTTTANTYSALNTFNGGVTIGTLSGVVYGNNGSLTSVATSTVANGTGISVSGSAAVVGAGGLTITNTGLLSLQQLGGGSAQTGAITFATSSQTTSGQTIGLNITNTSGAFTFSPTIGGTLTVAGGGTGLTTVADGALVYGSGGSTLSALATSTSGKILQLDFTTGRPTWVATSTLGLVVNAITSIGPVGQGQTGPAITIASSSSTTNGLTSAITITAAGNTITYAPTLSGTLTVAGGGTGVSSFTAGQLVYGNGTNNLTSVATSSQTLSAEFSDTGTFGALVGGTSGTLSLATNGVAYSKLAQAAANTILGNPTGATGNLQAFATSSLGIALADTTGVLPIVRGGTGTTTAPQGQLIYGGATSYQSVATGTVSSGTGISVTGNQYIIGSGLTITNTGVTSVAQSFGVNQTGAITLATSSAVSFNGLTFTNSITNSGGTFTFTPALSGTLGVAGGGTGVGSFTAGQLIYGNGTNNLTSVGTTSETLSSEFSFSGTYGARVGGTSGTLSLATNGVAYSKLAQAAANTILGNPTGATGNVVAFATSSLGIALSDTTGTLSIARGGTGTTTAPSGQIIYGGGAGVYQSVSTSTVANGTGISVSGSAAVVGAGGLTITNTGLLSLQQLGGGSAQTGAITFATSSQTINGQTIGLNITNTSGAFTFSPTIGGTLTVAGGGTGATSLSSGQLIYGAGTGAVQSVATTSIAVSGAFSYSGTLGSLVGGANGTLSLATNGVALTNIAQIAANSVLVNNTSGTGNVVAIATSTFFGLGTGGQVLTWNNGAPQWVATTTYSAGSGISTSFAAGNLTITNTGLLSLQQLGGGSAQTGAITFATSSNSSTGLTLGLNITNTSGAFTFTPTLGGTLNVGNGGTGATSFTAGSLVYGAGTGALQSVATTTATLGLGLSGTLTTLNSGGTQQLSIATSSLYTGTTGQFPYFSGTNTITATSTLFLSTAGNIGVGTATPTSRLSIFTSSSSVSPLLVTGPDGASVPQAIFAEQGDALGRIDGAIRVGDGLDLKWINNDGAALISGSDIRLQTSANHTFLRVYQGHVGIGGDGYGGLNAGASLEVSNNGTSDDLFKLSSNNTAGGDRFIVKNSGRVGIGTTSPFALLTIFATSTSANGTPTTLFQIASSSAGTATTTLFSVSNTGNAILAGGLTLGSPLAITSGGTGTSTTPSYGNILVGNSLGGYDLRATSTLGFGAGSVTSVDASGGTTGLSFSGGPITTFGTLTLSGTLGVANGGTGSTTLTGLLKGNGTGQVQTAIAGTDYQAPITAGTGLSLSGNTLNSYWTLNGSNNLFNNNSGTRVGIATGSPNYALDVGGFINTGAIGGYKQNGKTILYASSTNSSTLVGADAGIALTSAANYAVAVGNGALQTSQSAQFNTAVGYQALNLTTTGAQNTTLGAYTLANNSTGASNVAIGYAASYFNAFATNTVTIGNEAANGAPGYYANQGSVAIGYRAGYNFMDASDYNTLLGFQAGLNITSGARNIIIGADTTGSNSNLDTGSNNISIGNNISLPDNAGSNQLNIGNLIFGTGLSGTGSTISTGNIGIGTTSPYGKLSVVGNVVAANFIATTSASSTFAGPLSVSNLAITSNSGLLKASAGGYIVNAVAGTDYLTSASAVTSISQTGGGSAQTGAITFATSSVTSNGVTIGLNITNSAGAFTFTPTRSGTLTVAGGGTGVGSFTAGQLIYGNGTNNLTSVATTSATLGLGLSGTLTTLNSGGTQQLTIATSSLYTGTAGQVAYFSGANTLVGTSSIFVNTSTGNVGVGTTTPVYPLAVSGHNNGTVSIFDSAASVAQVRIMGTPGSAYAGVGTGGTAYLGAVSGLSVNNIAITTAGRLGIGTTVPQSTLHVEGTNSAVGGISIYSTTGTANGRLVIYPTGNTSVAFQKLSSNGVLSFLNSVGGEEVRIDNAGNFGVATSGPSAVFAVQGNAFFSGNISNVANLTATGTVSTTNLTVGSLNGPLQANNGVVSATTSVGVLYGGTGLTSVGNNALLYGSGGNSLNTLAASTNGFVLSLSGGVPTWVATSSISNGVSSIQQLGGGSAQTGAITFATSSQTTNGQTIGLNITNSSGAFTFSPTISGTLTVAGGGTGVGSFTAGSLVYGAGTGALQSVATSSASLGLGLSGSLIGVGAGQSLSIATSSLYTGTTGQVAYFNATNGIVGTSTLFLGTNSTVGIGTVTPSTLLDVYGNTNASSVIRVTNGNSGNAAVASFTLESNNGSSQLFKTSTGYAGYKTILANDLGFYNSSVAGNISILNDYASGKILFAAGGSSLAQLAIDSNGNVGVASTSPFARLSVHANNGSTATTLFAIGSSTASATTTLFSINNTGSTTAVNGFNITAGCFAINNNCLSTSGGVTSIQQLGGGSAQTGAITFATSSQTTNGQTIGLNITNTGGAFTFAPVMNGTLTVGGGGTGATSFTAGSLVYGAGTGALQSVATTSATLGLGLSGTLTTLNAGGTQQISIATSSLYTGTTGQFAYFSGTNALVGTSTLFVSTSGNVGVGTTSPWAQFSINPNNIGASPILAIGSSTGTSFMVANNGRVAVGSTSPYARLSIHANNGDTHKMLFAVGSSTAAESIPFFSISNTGNVGIGGTNSTNSGFTQLTVTAGTSTITRIGQANLSGARNPGIWVQGRYAYIVQGGNTTNGLEIFDVSTSTPSFVSRIDLATGNNAAYQGNDIIVQGRYAYVVEGYGSTNAFEIFDVSNPNRPTRISQSDLAYGQFWTNKTIEIQGRYAYILGGGQTTSALEIFDISNPAAPVRISQTNITNGGQTYSDMHVQGRYAYIVEGSGTTNAFEIFDVSNPAVPVRVGQANLANTTNLAGTSIFVQGSYAYIVEAAAANGFEIFDISDPTAPIRLSQTTTLNSGAGGTNPDIWVQGRYAYIAGTGTTNAFEVYDISNPAAPMLVSRKNLTVGGANAMYIQGRYAYIAQGGTTNAFEVFDLGGAYIQQLETGGIETTSLAVRGNLYAMDGNFQGGLTVERSLAVTGASSFVAASSTHNTATGIFNVTTASSTSSIISALGNGRVGIGSTTPFAKLSISANFGETNTTLFAIGSSTSASATTTLFTVLSTGQVNIPTGSLGFPGLSFVGDTTTGIYRPTASALGVIAGGTESFRVTGVNAIIRNDGVYQFATGALTAGGADAGLSRFGAGVVALGNGTAANTSGTLLATMIGLGTTTPFGALQIGTTTGKNLVLSDTAAGTNLKHWLFSSHGGNLYIGTTTDLYATSTPAFTLLGGTGSNAGYFGLGTSSPFSKLSVSGASSLAKFKSTTNVANALSVENAAGSNVFQIDTLDTNGSLFTIATSTGTSYMEVTSAGNIGIGTSTPGAKFDIYNGALCVDDSTPTCQNAARTAGTIYAVATSITGIDIAESYPTKDGTLAAGQIVVFDPANPVFVKRAHTGAQAFLGVVSTAPGIVLGGYNDDLYAAEHKVPIALAGRVPVTVNMEGGSIAVGDLITLSSVDGVGKKATESGQTIGIALESATGAGTIQVFIKPEYSFIPTQFALNPTTGNVGIGVATPSQKLEVAGNGLFNGSVTASHFNALGAGTSTLSRLAVSNAFTLGSQYLTSFTGTGLALDGGILSIASSTFANLHTQGGNSFGTTSVIGTRDTNDITFITASTTRLTITADGKVGIGTTTPNHALQVVGDIGAIGFVNTSTRTAKTDITYLTASTTENILERIQAVRVARYHYKIEDDNEPLRLGLIAEEAPYEVLSADGKGVDVYKLASFTLAGVQALAHKVDTIEEKVASIDERLTQLQNVSLHQATTTDTNTDVIATTTGALQQLFRGVGALIQNGVAQFNTLVARQFVASKDADGTSSAGAGTILTGNTSVEVTNKIARASSKIFVTFTSPVDGGWYLSEKKDGSFRVVLKTAATEDVTFDYFIVQTEGQLASPESLAGGPAPEHGPTITLNGASPYYVAVGESYAEPGANAFDGSGATIEYNVAVDGQTTNLHPQLDTSAPRTFTITYTAFDSHGSFSTKTRTVIVAAPGETTPPAQTPDGGSTEPPVPPEVPSGELTSEPETPPAPTDTGTTTPDA